MSGPTCPKCDAPLKYKELMRTGVDFPCPACDVQLSLTRWYMASTGLGTLVAPALIFWALGASWPQVIFGGMLLAWPAFLLMARYGKYVLRPKIVLYVPPTSFKEDMAYLRGHRPPREPHVPLNGPVELRLRDRPRPPWV